MTMETIDLEALEYQFDEPASNSGYCSIANVTNVRSPVLCITQAAAARTGHMTLSSPAPAPLITPPPPDKALMSEVAAQRV